MNRLLAALALVALVGCGEDVEVVRDAVTELQSEDLVVGTGATAANGDVVSVHYTGTFLDGRVFDTSANRGPFTFRLGAGSVISGWELGVPGMRVGGRRRLTIPPSLAYGSQGSPPTIPPNATLRFEIELLAIAGR